MQTLVRTAAAWALLFALTAGLMLALSPGAAQAADVSNCDTKSIEGGVECINQGGDAPDLLSVVESIINTMLFVIGIIAVIMLIYGGIRYVVSGGSQTQVEGARNTIMFAIIGLIVAFVAWGAVNFVVTALSDNA